MRIIDHGFMNKIPMLYATQQNGFVYLPYKFTRYHIHTYSLTHLLTHTLCAILFLSFTCPSLWIVVSLWEHTFSQHVNTYTHDTHTHPTFYPFCSFGPVHKKSFGWFFSPARIHRQICESSSSKLIQLTHQGEKDNVVIDFNDKFFYRLMRSANSYSHFFFWIYMQWEKRE